MTTERIKATQISRDRDHGDRNTSDHDCVYCHSYHLTALVVTISKYVVVNISPMMGDHKDNTNKDKSLP
jgi:hypothetical protein